MIMRMKYYQYIFKERYRWIVENGYLVGFGVVNIMHIAKYLWQYRTEIFMTAYDDKYMDKGQKFDYRQKH